MHFSLLAVFPQTFILLVLEQVCMVSAPVRRRQPNHDRWQSRVRNGNLAFLRLQYPLLAS